MVEETLGVNKGLAAGNMSLGECLEDHIRTSMLSHSLFSLSPSLSVSLLLTINHCSVF